MTTENEKETRWLAARLAKKLKKGSIVCLEGELGSGKTTFVKGLAEGLKVNPDKVHSPTFVFLNIYEGKKELYHFDLYRNEGKDNLRGLGIDEFLYGNGVSVIEWAEKLGEFAPKEALYIGIKNRGGDRRELIFVPRGERYRDAVEGILTVKKAS